MKVLVPLKQVVDPNLRIRIRDDGSGIDAGGLKTVANPFDEIALEEALRMREAGHTDDVSAVSIGPQSADETLRAALAMGADTALRIDHPAAPEPLAVARLLAALVGERGYDLVLLGKQAVDDDCGQTGPMLSALLDWPLATFASRIEVEELGLCVTREVDTGIQRVRLDLPAVVTVDLRLNTPRFASLPNIMKARRRLIETLAASKLSEDLTPRVQRLGVAAPPQRSSVRMMPSVDALVAALRERGAL